MIESPCIGLCALEKDICVGCFRTRQEIQDWLYMTPEQRRDIINNRCATRSHTYFGINGEKNDCVSNR